MRSRRFRAALALATLSAASCASTLTVPPQRTPSYRYAAPKSEAGKGISVAILRPTLAKRLLGTPADTREYAALRDALARSLLEYMTAQGMTVSGPFSAVEDMTFPEKKQADLLLSAEFDTDTTVPTGTSAAGSFFSPDPTVSSNGSCQITGRVSFVVWEPLSMQRMWSKTLDITPVTAACSFSFSGTNAGEAWRVAIMNAAAGLSEQMFNQTMAAAARYFDPGEVALIKAQSAELREKKVY